MNRMPEARGSRTGTVGWLLVLLGGALLAFQGVNWYLTGPGTALENIAERTPLDAQAFRDGGAFDVITIVTRSQAVYGAALGLLALVVGWRGFRDGAAWTWWASWISIAAIAIVGLSFVLADGAGIGGMYLGLAGVIGLGLFLARRSIVSERGRLASNGGRNDQERLRDDDGRGATAGS